MQRHINHRQRVRRTRVRPGKPGMPGHRGSAGSGGIVLRARSPEGRYRVAPEKHGRDRKKQLTPIEQSLMEGLCAGMSNAQLAAVIGRSEKTVRNQLTKVYAKLGVNNRAHAVAVYLGREWKK